MYLQWIRPITKERLWKHCIIILPPSLTALQSPFPWPHLCWNTCYGSSFPGGCSPPSTCTRLHLRLPGFSLLLHSTKEQDAWQSCCHEDVQVAPMGPVRTSQTSSVPMTTGDTWLASQKTTDLVLQLFPSAKLNNYVLLIYYIHAFLKIVKTKWNQTVV